MGGERLWVLLAEHARAVGDELLLDLDRLVIAPHVPQRDRDVRARAQRAGIIGPALLDAQLQHAPQLRERGLVLLVLLGDDVGGVLGVGQLGVLPAEDRLCDRSPSLGLRLAVAPIGGRRHIRGGGCLVDRCRWRYARSCLPTAVLTTDRPALRLLPSGHVCSSSPRFARSDLATRHTRAQLWHATLACSAQTQTVSSCSRASCSAEANTQQIHERPLIARSRAIRSRSSGGW